MNNAKLFSAAATLILIVAPGYVSGHAQEERSGSSKPPEAIITVTPAPDDTTTPVSPAPIYRAPAKPSAAIAADPDPVDQVPAAPISAATRPAVTDPGAAIVGDTIVRPVVADFKPANDPDAGIVTRVPSRPNELPEGAVVKVKLRQTLSTVTTRVGSPFSGEITEPLMRDGKVLIPEGSLVSGRVTMVHSGKRLGASAAMHLEPHTVTLPDGSQYLLHARVIDTDRWNDTKVDSEGTILRRDHTKGTSAAMLLTTGGGAAAGGVIGGVPGALIGAGVGAGIGTVVWLKQDRQAELPKDLVLVFSLTSPMMVTPETALVHASAATTGE